MAAILQQTAIFLCVQLVLCGKSYSQIAPAKTSTLLPTGSNVCTYRQRVESKDINGKSTVKYLTAYRCCDGWTKHRSYSVDCMVRTKCYADSYNFVCDSGKCLDNRYICDGVDQCGDGSDERMCGSCPAGYFRCYKDDACLPRRLYCDAIVDCGDPKKEIPEDEKNCALTIKLMGTTSTSRYGHVNKGVVGLWHYGTWGSLCDDYMGLNDAHVLCRSLGFKQAIRTIKDNSLGTLSASYPIWMDDLACTGNEQALVQCDKPRWGVHNCGHHEDVAIECSEEHLPQIHIVGRRGLSARYSGRRPMWWEAVRK